MEGYVDFHIHLDRARTHRNEFVNHEAVLEDLVNISLRKKQSAVGILHRGIAYQDDQLRTRMDGVLAEKFAAGESLINAIIDTPDDEDGVGLRAFNIALELREKYDKRVNIGAYPIFGFESRDSSRHEAVKEAAKRAQFLMGLPERDLGKPIGFDGHLQLLFELGHKHGLPVHVHVDQKNDPDEDGTETLLEAVRWLGSPVVKGTDGPTVWAVHELSPAGYHDDRFWPLIEKQKKYNVGMVVCPHATASNKQPRDKIAPTHNSVARIWECMAAGIEVRMGTDNVDDIMMPRPKSCLLERELDMLCSISRFYNEGILDKLFRGIPLNETDRNTLSVYLPQGFNGSN